MSNSGKETTRRQLLITGVAAGITAASAAALFGTPVGAAAEHRGKSKEEDIAILNAALDLENQGIWAYTAAAPKLSSTDVGRTVLALALRNRADHEKHRDTLKSA